MAKYSLTAEDGLYRLTALVAIELHGVNPGDPGGLVESPASLCHAGSCWVAGNAVVADGGRVTGDALVSEDAAVLGGGIVGAVATVSGCAIVRGTVVGNANVLGSAIVMDLAYVSSGTIDSGVYVESDDQTMYLRTT